MLEPLQAVGHQGKGMKNEIKRKTSTGKVRKVETGNPLGSWNPLMPLKAFWLKFPSQISQAIYGMPK